MMTRKPNGSDGKARNLMVATRLSDSERAALEAAAKQQGHSVSAELRRLVLEVIAVQRQQQAA